MRQRSKILWLGLICFILIIPNFQFCSQKTGDMMKKDDFSKIIIKEMEQKFGKEYSGRIKIGVGQINKIWLEQDGSKEEMKQFCLDNFIADEAELKRAFDKIEHAFEQINGLLVEMDRELQWNLQIETGPIQPIDHLLSNFNLAAHVKDDLFNSKVAFWVLLNFKINSLDDCLKNGDKWSREEWAKTRLAQNFTSRVPSAVSQKIHKAFISADNYISNYNIYMNNLLTEDDQRLFPKGLKLITHWNLRDELKAQYDKDDGFVRQKMIYNVMQKIISQEIPEIVINNPDVDWKISSNEVSGTSTDNSREPDTRYQHLLNIFHAEKNADSYYPLFPNFIDRKFNRDREIPEKVVEELFDELLKSREFQKTGKLIKKRLGRDLEPFDIWYTGFRVKSKYNEDELTEIVSKKYPDVKTFEENIPVILQKLGFSIGKAEYLGSKIAVDAARGAGHAMGAGRRGDKAHLRTRIPEQGMDYKGFNIAIHELGHNVEQTFSLYDIDHNFLEGVPNTAFTEAFAFLFQSRDLKVLGLEGEDEKAEHYKALNQLWSVCEIAGVSLVDMEVWRWMYANPECTAAELKEATIDISRNVWNKYFYPVIGHKDATILGIYSHMIDAGLYLPDYPVGHIIQFQIEEYIKDKDLATEMERMCTIGSVTPDRWMKQAVQEEISVKPLLKAADRGLRELY